MGNKLVLNAIIIVVILVLVVYVGIWKWGMERTWVPPHESRELIRLTGGAAPKDSYAGPGQQGVIEQMLGPGRHFLMPWEYSTKVVPDFEVPPGHIALVRNNVGKDLPEGRYIAGPDEKGTQLAVLTPGVWRLNEFGQTHYIQPDYAAKGFSDTQPMTYIPPGYVGVQTLTEEIRDPKGNVVTPKGILPTVLQPGYYAINPEQVKVTVVGVGYDVFEMHVDYESAEITDKDGKVHQILKPREGTGVSFPLADGKQMYLDITVVWGVFPADAPRLVADYGTLDMLQEKVIHPQIISICKNAGSDMTTRDFIAGNTRDQFQATMTRELQAVGKEKGIHFLIALVRGFHPDPSIVETIQAKMLAEEELITLATEQDRDTVAGELEAAKRKVATALQDFNSETAALVAEKKEEGLKAAAMVKADADRRVAAIERQVAELNAEGVKIDGQAEADVLETSSRAQAELMKLLVGAYGGADNFNLATFAKNLPEDLKIEYHYAGPGTLWTDMQGNIQQTAAKKILSDSPAK
ncbi:MAG TPA: SPFH domain-containing protein [Phycisphaerae bacterium]|nr:SPFH domain-containing protein [Phycisphaerae bacterium]